MKYLTTLKQRSLVPTGINTHIFVKRICTVHVPEVDLEDEDPTNWIHQCWATPKPTTPLLYLFYWNLYPQWDIRKQGDARKLLVNVCHTMDCVSPFHHREGRLSAKTRHFYKSDVYLPDIQNRPLLMHYTWRTAWQLRYEVTKQHSAYALTSKRKLEEYALESEQSKRMAT